MIWLFSFVFYRLQIIIIVQEMDLDLQLPWLEDIHLPKAEVRTITSDHLCSLVVPIEIVIQSSYLYHACSPVCFLLIWRHPLDENSRPDRNQVHQKHYLFSHFPLDLMLRIMLRYVPYDRTWVVYCWSNWQWLIVQWAICLFCFSASTTKVILRAKYCNK